MSQDTNPTTEPSTTPAATPPAPPPAPAVPPAKVSAKAPTPPPDTSEPEIETIGDAGYARVVELLSKSPVNVPGLPPKGTGVPADLRDWLRAFKEPLALMTVDAASSAVRAKIGGYHRGRIKELYAHMTPAQIAAVMEGNAAAIKKFADQRVNEAAMIGSITTRLTNASAGFLLSALAAV